jgi:hypothetical protein
VNDYALQQRHQLSCHPATPCAALESVQVDIARHLDTLRIGYTLAGRIDALRVPVAIAPVRSDGLWRHLCCELFIRRAGEAGYREFNFSPSGEWAAYAFSSYRAGMTPLGLARRPMISVQSSANRWHLQVLCPVNATDGALEHARLMFGCGVVVEELRGGLSYWALRHPPGKPDFHHGDGFMGEMD